MDSIVLKNICKDFDNIKVLKDISVNIKQGEFVVIIGESGCGKSTLLRILSGLETITSGELYFDEKLANNIPPKDRDIAMVFQSYALYPHMTVYNNIAYSLKILKVSKDIIDKKVKEVAVMLGIDKYLDYLPKNLSGGQRQRVAMGRAIIRNPKIFLFDEPLSNLDAKLRVSMRSEIKKLQEKLNTTTIYVTHDQIEAMTLADKVILLDKGKIVQIGTPEELYDKPNSIFSASFLGIPKISLVNGVIKNKDDKVFVITNNKYEFEVRKTKTKLNDGDNVVLGIHPRDIYLSNDNKIKLNIDFFEYTGAENIIYGNIGDDKMTIVLSKNEKIDKKQDHVFIGYDIDNTYIFNRKTEKVIN